MKRYLVFFGVTYHPESGMRDLLNDFDSIDECKDAIDNKIEELFNPNWNTLEEHIEYQWELHWANIYDTKNRQEVWSKN